ncbi:polyamine-transporting ATPase [Actinoplanes sp. NBRC 14428]|uniref:Spermidine/putrescine import ATP-binding protein PotA n=1 Tax=Pseudosporangium ferrugineum TaxID=439699 RepID=A0A2T0SCU3_9ACTN|nr:ABC transporter ATP-binding protein [Pseudosporangium ferrugineum]PRY31250.1 putative spermidine/putrescine transport system ATP-binding protein [Pseudosporangium ferrugineum]BCJ54616.1 polyamine-transporting ATPase [Actinoplanes sp. NBRC 14428]
MPTSGTQIRLTGVTKDYGLAVPAVDDVSLTIEPGEFMTLLGPSGSGKTTTLNLIAGFETLTSGTIEFNSADVSSLPPHKRNLGMLFQNYALFPHMTVAQNVAYPLRERKLPKAEIARKVAEVLELVQLTGRDGHHPSQLSGGQQQRVALARAIVFDPNALLLDEPLGALDRNLRGALQAEIHRIHQEVGTTFVFVTHDQEEAMNLSDRIALFNNGRIEQVGTPEALYQRPETLFTARFLGDSNVFEPSKTADGTIVWENCVWATEPGTVSDLTKAGTRAALVVRPEDVHIAADGDVAPTGANAVAATIRDIEYMGAYRTAVLSLGQSGTVGRARLGALESGLTVGQSVTAWWHVGRQRLVAV